jgi:glutaredoxin-related protein
LSKKANTIYVPQIWIKGKHIGSFEQLWKMHHRKQIEELLNGGKVELKTLNFEI